MSAVFAGAAAAIGALHAALLAGAVRGAGPLRLAGSGLLRLAMTGAVLVLAAKGGALLTAAASWFGGFGLAVALLRGRLA